jgi:PAS domain S-box-containing protein
MSYSSQTWLPALTEPDAPIADEADKSNAADSGRGYRPTLLSTEAASVERVFGYTEEEALGRLPPDVTEEHLTDFRDNLARAVNDVSATGSLEARRRRKDGKIMDVLIRWARVYDGARQRMGIMYAVTDITERKKLESQLQQSQKMEAIGNLTGGMAHDFNNLLGVIIGNLELLQERQKGDSEVELAREALDAALSGADLTRRLLAFARRQPLEPRRADINELITRISKLLDRTLGEEIEISLELGAEVWPVVVDPAQLDSSLTNLATNARDAMPEGGHLTIVTSNQHLDDDYASQHAEVQPGDYAMIEVSDTGSGMPSGVASRIFEPFYTTKEQGKGTGLGLSMVFGFIKQSGGHINVYSEVGIGTTFRLYLPRADADAEAAEAVTLQPFARGRGETVLAVDDNENLRRIVVRILDELGYRVLQADDAKTALKILASEAVDLLFTDVVMPGGASGYALADAAQSRWPQVKVLLTSGLPEKAINADGKRRNLRTLSKPVRKDDLARTLREVLDA